MTFRDTLGLAWRNLGQARLRTSLTTLGVSIGIASLAGMVSLGVGLQDQFVSRFTRSGVFDSVTVLSAADLPGGFARLGGAGRQGFGRRGAPGSTGTTTRVVERKTLNDDTINELSSMPHVREVYPNVRVPLQMKFNGEQESFAAAGVPMSVKGQGAFASISYGAFFPNDTDATCMLSLDLAKRMMGDNPGALVGQTVTLAHISPAAAATAIAGGGFTSVPKPEETPCRVVGIVERETGPGGLVQVTPVMLPLGLAKTMSVRQNEYPSLTVKVEGPQFTQDVEDAVKKKGFSAFSLNDALQGAKRAFIILDIVLSLIGSIALSVSALGIVNTMVMSILERTREIGIMKAIGGSDADIRRIFLIEASAIGLLGGAVGIVLGWAVGRVINFGANVYIQQQGAPPANLFSLPLWLIGGAIGFSIVISLIAGSYPAARAAKLDPIQALRHD
jgi:putative ABC transport system permease protein